MAPDPVSPPGGEEVLPGPVCLRQVLVGVTPLGDSVAHQVCNHLKEQLIRSKTFDYCLMTAYLDEGRWEAHVLLAKVVEHGVLVRRPGVAYSVVALPAFVVVVEDKLHDLGCPSVALRHPIQHPVVKGVVVFGFRILKNKNLKGKRSSDV